MREGGSGTAGARARMFAHALRLVYAPLACVIGLAAVFPDNHGLLFTLEVPFLSLVFLFYSLRQSLLVTAMIAACYVLAGALYGDSGVLTYAQLAIVSLAFAGARSLAWMVYAGRHGRYVFRAYIHYGMFSVRIILSLAASLAQVWLLRDMVGDHYGLGEHLALQAILNWAGLYVVDCLAWAAMGRPRAAWRGNGLTLALTAASMLLPSIGVFHYVNATYSAEIQTRAQSNAQRLAMRISQHAELNAQHLNAYKAFMDGSERVTRDEFRAFHQSVAEPRFETHVNVAWAPVVLEEQRAAFEAARRQQLGLAEFKIWERNSRSQAAQGVSVRTEYYPIDYVEPFSSQAQMLGFDMGSEPELLATLRRAAESGQPARSGTVHLEHDQGHHHYYIEAVYVPRNAGFLVATVDQTELIRLSHISQGAGEENLDFEVRAESSNELVYSTRPTREMQGLISAASPVPELNIGSRVQVFEPRLQSQTWSVAQSAWVLNLMLLLGFAVCGCSKLLLNQNYKLLRQSRRNHMARAHLLKINEHLHQSERMATLGAMVAGITHEVNTPLNVAMLAAENIPVLAERVGKLRPDSDQRQALLERIADSGGRVLSNLKRAAKLINQFKLVSTDATSQRHTRVALLNVIERVTYLLEPKLRRAGCELTIAADADLQLDTRPGPLSQVLIILIDNCILHAFPWPAYQPRIELTAGLLSGNRVEIRCNDNGVGVVDELRTTLFEPYSSSKLGEGGTGIGLYIAKTIVHNQLGGQMRYEPGASGSCFVIELPA